MAKQPIYRLTPRAALGLGRLLQGELDRRAARATAQRAENARLGRPEGAGVPTWEESARWTLAHATLGDAPVCRETGGRVSNRGRVLLNRLTIQALKATLGRRWRSARLDGDTLRKVFGEIAQRSGLAGFTLHESLGSDARPQPGQRTGSGPPALSQGSVRGAMRIAPDAAGGEAAKAVLSTGQRPDQVVPKPADNDAPNPGANNADAETFTRRTAIPPGFLRPESGPESGPGPRIPSDAQIIQAMAESLRAVSRTVVRRGRDEGELDVGRLSETGAGLNLHSAFQHVATGRSRAVAVQVYLDLSGSMRGSRSKQTIAALGTLARGLDRARIPWELIGFAEVSFRIKGFSEHLKRGTLASLLANGKRTHGADAARIWMDSLAARREARRVAVVLTDGDIQPESDEWKARDRHGIELHVISIDGDCRNTREVRRHMPIRSFLDVPSGPTLGRTMAEHIRRKLAGRPGVRA